jgi:hypothetical protein
VEYFALGAVFLVVRKKEYIYFFYLFFSYSHPSLIIIASIPHLPLPLVGKKVAVMYHAYVHIGVFDLTLKHSDTFHF